VVIIYINYFTNCIDYLMLNKFLSTRHIMNSEITTSKLHTFMMETPPLSTRTRFRFLKQNYGYDTYKAYQYLEKISIQIVRLRSDLDYLYECK